MTEKKKQLPLATFRIAPDKADVWEKFKAKVEENKTTGAALFWQFVQNYVDGVDTNIDTSIYHVDSNLDKRIDSALEAKVDFSIRNISRVADEQYERLVALLAQNKIDIDERIDSALNSPRSGNKENAIASLLANIERIESTIGSQDNKIVALEAIVIGLPTTFISTKQVEAIFDREIAPLLARLEALETNLSTEATAPRKFYSSATSESQGNSAAQTDGSSVEPESLPIIEAIATIADPTIEPQSRQNLTELSESEKNNVLDNVLTQIILDENKPKPKAPDETLTEAIANTAAPSIDNPLADETFTDAITDTDLSKGMNNGEAYQIACDRGFTTESKDPKKAFRESFDETNIRSDLGLRRVPHKNGKEKWLYFDTKSRIAKK